MILADKTIKEEIRKGRIVIEPFDEAMLKPASVYLHLSNQFRVFRSSYFSYLEVKNSVEELMELISLKDDQAFVLHPGDFVLGSTRERVTLSGAIAARLHGRSGFGRLGIIIHSTAGYIDPGFSGYLTFEMANLSRIPVAIPIGVKIAQISFTRLTSRASILYGDKTLRSKYQNQKGPTASYLYLDFLRNGRRKR